MIRLTVMNISHGKARRKWSMPKPVYATRCGFLIFIWSPGDGSSRKTDYRCRCS